MPYNPASKRKRQYKRRSSAARNAKYIKKSKSARAQQLQLTSLQRQLTATKSKLRDRAQYAQFFCPIEQGTGQDTSQIDLTDNEFYVNNLMRPSSWQAIFQSNNNTEVN